MGSLVDAIIPGFVRHLQRPFRRGLFQGYRSEENALPTVLGRIRFGDRIRDRFGLMLNCSNARVGYRLLSFAKGHRSSHCLESLIRESGNRPRALFRCIPSLSPASDAVY
jgi:hypothetical protein